MKTSPMVESALPENARAVKQSLTVAGSERIDINGHVNRGFEIVREAFAENFVRRRELG